MRLPAAILTVVVLIAAVPLVSGQHRRIDEGERKPGIVGYDGVGPSLIYVIQAQVIPESALVRGQVDIQYQNSSADTIKTLYLDLGRNSYPAEMEVDFYGAHTGGVPARGKAGGSGTYTIVDSILYRASRLEQAPVMITDSLMQLTLPVGIAPGETGQLLVPFETHLIKAGTLGVTTDNWFVARRWFPGLAAFEVGCEGGVSAGGSARYDAILRIDSSYSLIAPGELLNEKLHYGTFEQSKSDTVFTDVLSHIFAFSKSQGYTPTFETGFKDYYLLLPSAEAFPLVVTKEMKLDRAYAGEVPVEVYYPKDMAGRVQKRVAKLARDLAEELQQKLGVFPFPKLMVVALDRKCALDGVHELIGIDKDESSPRMLYPYLATQIAGCWFGDSHFSADEKVTTTSPCLLAAGIGHYVAMRVMYDSLGEQSTDLLKTYDRLTSRCAVGEAESVFEKAVTVKVPWEIRMLRFLVGDSSLWQVVATCSREFRTGYPSTADFERIVADVAGKNLDWFFREWQQPDAHLDYYLSGVAYKTDDSGVTVRGYVRNHGNVYMPVELAFVTRPGDTLLETLSYNDFDKEQGEASFSVHLPSRPRAVVIDPHHFLYDGRLANNTWMPFGRRPGYREPSIPIPRFRN